jgi:hypothetical protein
MAVPCDVFIIIFTSLQLSYQEGQGPQLSGEKQNEASLSGTNSTNLCQKSTVVFSAKKTTHCKKNPEMYSFITERVEISQKFQRIWIQQAKTNYSE